MASPTAKKRQCREAKPGKTHNGSYRVAVVAEKGERVVVTLKKQAAPVLSEYMSHAFAFGGSREVKKLCDFTREGLLQKMHVWQVDVLNKNRFKDRDPKRVRGLHTLRARTWTEVCDFLKLVQSFAPDEEVLPMLLMRIHKSMVGSDTLWGQVTLRAVVDWNNPLLSSCILTPLGRNVRDNQLAYMVKPAVTNDRQNHPFILQVLQQAQVEVRNLVGLLVKTAITGDEPLVFVPADTLNKEGDADVEELRAYLSGDNGDIWHHVPGERLDGAVGKMLFELHEQGVPPEVAKVYASLVFQKEAQRKESRCRTLRRPHAPLEAQNLYESAWEESLSLLPKASVKVGKRGWGGLHGLVAALNKRPGRTAVSCSVGREPRVRVQRQTGLKLSKCWFCQRKLHNAKSVLGSSCRQKLMGLLVSLQLESEPFEELRALMHSNPSDFKRVFSTTGNGNHLKDLKAQVQAALGQDVGENFEVST
jgi:hypothetical protein